MNWKDQFKSDYKVTYSKLRNLFLRRRGTDLCVGMVTLEALGYADREGRYQKEGQRGRHHEAGREVNTTDLTQAMTMKAGKRNRLQTTLFSRWKQLN